MVHTLYYSCSMLAKTTATNIFVLKSDLMNKQKTAPNKGRLGFKNLRELWEKLFEPLKAAAERVGD